MSDIHRIQFIIPTESYGKQGYKLLPTTSAVPSQMNKPKINAINTTLNMSLFFIGFAKFFAFKAYEYIKIFWCYCIADCTFVPPLGLGLQLALSCISNRNPTPNPKGGTKVQ